MLKLIIVILMPVLFVARETLRLHFYPNLVTVTGEWDSSNALTMNVYACIIGLTFLQSTLPTKCQITYFFIFISIWESFFDVLLRLAFHEYFKTEKDKIFIHLTCIILASITYAVTQNRRLNKQSNS